MYKINSRGGVGSKKSFSRKLPNIVHKNLYLSILVWIFRIRFCSRTLRLKQDRDRALRQGQARGPGAAALWPIISRWYLWNPSTILLRGRGPKIVLGINLPPPFISPVYYNHNQDLQNKILVLNNFRDWSGQFQGQALQKAFSRKLPYILLNLNNFSN